MIVVVKGRQVDLSQRERVGSNYYKLEAGNVLYVGGGSVLSKNSRINFYGENSLVYVEVNNPNANLKIDIFNHSIVYIGANCIFNGTLNIMCSESENVLIGNFCMFSYGITIRNSDAHPIFDIDNLVRINKAKTVMIGDHCWISQGCLILKGTRLNINTILGAGTIIANKVTEANSIYIGNPAKLIKTGVIWDRKCVHASVPHRSVEAFPEMDIEMLRINQSKLIMMNGISKECSAVKKCQMIINNQF